MIFRRTTYKDKDRKLELKSAIVIVGWVEGRNPCSTTVHCIEYQKDLFPLLGREEIENMLGLSELKQTKVYQKALREGEQICEQRGEQTDALREAGSLILRQLTRRVGTISPHSDAKISALSIFQLESLGEALLDFSSSADLDNWLRSQA